jgi:hypothetical protein
MDLGYEKGVCIRWKELDRMIREPSRTIDTLVEGD